MVVRIETERLILRPMGVQDLQDLLDLHTQPATIEFLGATTPKLARERLALCERNWAQGGYDLLAVLDRSTGEFLGRAGVKYWPQFNETEAGWAFRREAWGHGYATEAARASIDWAFRTLPVPYVTAMIRPDNSRSQAVARRLGLAPLREDVVVGIPVTVHAVDRRRWGAAAQPDEVEQLLAHVARWAARQPDLVAVALVGSRARGDARADSDVDLVLLSHEPGRYIYAEEWAGELGGVAVLASAQRGMLVEQRLRTESGTELDIAIGPPRWAQSAPAEIGVRAIHDPDRLLKHLTRAAG